MKPRVLLCGRPDLFTKAGGDTHQILHLRHALGDQAQLSLDPHPDLRQIDIVHVFNLSRPLEPLLVAEHARQAHRLVVFTTIYQDLGEYHRRGRQGLVRGLALLCGHEPQRLMDLQALVHFSRSRRPVAAARALLHMAPILGGHLKRQWPHRRERFGLTAAMQQQLLSLCHCFIFTAPAEANLIEQHFNEPTLLERGRFVPVGFNSAELSPLDPAPFIRRYGLTRFILSIGRLEDLKNQLALIQSLAHDPIPLVLIGRRNPAHHWYARRVARAAAARPQTLLLLDLPRKMVLSALAAAAVHVQPSWFETTGLASLEAAAAGCAVVITTCGYARAFFGDEAFYCDPADPATIRLAVLTALHTGPSASLQQRVWTHYTSTQEAATLATIYQELWSTLGS